MRPDTRRTPGFTAAAALRPASRRYRGAGAPGPADDGGEIVPSMLPRVLRRGGAQLLNYGITMTCSARDAASCTATCDALGGGMMSDATGTVSCHIY